MNTLVICGHGASGVVLAKIPSKDDKLSDICPLNHVLKVYFTKDDFIVEKRVNRYISTFEGHEKYLISSVKDISIDGDYLIELCPNLHKITKFVKDPIYKCSVFENGGTTLHSWIKNNIKCKYFDKKIRKIIIELCKCALFVHNNGFFHGDIKETNIMIKEFNGNFSVKLIDFGLMDKTKTWAKHLSTFAKYEYYGPEAIFFRYGRLTTKKMIENKVSAELTDSFFLQCKEASERAFNQFSENYREIMEKGEIYSLGRSFVRHYDSFYPALKESTWKIFVKMTHIELDKRPTIEDVIKEFSNQ